MATLAQVRARVETDLADPDLVALLSDAQLAISERHGPDRDTAAPLTVDLLGGRRFVEVTRPIDVAEPFTVTELRDGIETVLADTEFRLWDGHTLERLNEPCWGEVVTISYVPVDDQARRDEVEIKLVMLAVEYEGVTERSVGDVDTRHFGSGEAGGIIYSDERETLLESLSPTRAVVS